MKNFLKSSFTALILIVFSVSLYAGNRNKISADIDLVHSYILMQDYEKVISVSESLINLKLAKKQKYFVLCSMAQAYNYLKKFELAVEKGKEAEKLYNNKTEPKMILGRIYEENALYELAGEKFREVLEIDSDNINALTELGNVNKINENYKDALYYYKLADSLHNKNMDEEFYLQMAECAKELGRFTEAQHILESVYLKNKSKRISLALAYIYRKQERYSKAVSVLVPFTENKKYYDTEIYANLALVYMLAREYENVKKLLTGFVLNHEDSDMINLVLAEAHFALSERQQAFNILDKILLNAKSENIRQYAGMLKTVFKKYKI